MEEFAQGRVWAGKDAASRGLIDAVGGLSRAIAIAKHKVNIPQDRQVSSLLFILRRTNLFLGWILLLFIISFVKNTTPNLLMNPVI